MDSHTLQKLFKKHIELHLQGRYIALGDLELLFEKHQINFHIETIGASVLKKSIKATTIGNGNMRILMWSQMHGNESTTTKAVFDLCNLFANSHEPFIQHIKDHCTIAIIPMLNPDGAFAYTRENANGIDLNRDAQDLSQPESKALRTFFEKFRPDFCFNLHGQRTIFSAGQTNKSATISFLAPAQDKICTITDTRKKAMEIIVKMNENLQQQIPNQVGIYDDAFNLNCVGDTFQHLNVPTILFEAGHYSNDYHREVVRGFIFQSLVLAIDYIGTQKITGKDYQSYTTIPENKKLFYDIIIRKGRIKDQTLDIAIQYQEVLVGRKIEFKPIVDKISDLSGYYGHKEVEANDCAVLTAEREALYVGYENDFVVINNELFSLNI